MKIDLRAPCKKNGDSFNQQCIDLIMDALKSIQFGSVEITVHNGRVVQLEKREKLRFDAHNLK